MPSNVGSDAELCSTVDAREYLSAAHLPDEGEQYLFFYEVAENNALPLFFIYFDIYLTLQPSLFIKQHGSDLWQFGGLGWWAH
jgi:hypothetical protein